MTFAELREALAVFGLEDRVTLREIRARHRELVKRHHPDVGGEDSGDRIRKINAAYKLIMEYVASYRFSFAEDEFYEQNPEERIRRQFMDDPVWGRE